MSSSTRNPSASQALDLVAQYGTIRRRMTVAALLVRDGDRCPYCSVQFSAETPPTIDHRIPTTRGGVSAIENYDLNCAACNNDKGPMTRDEYRQVLRARRAQAPQARSLGVRRPAGERVASACRWRPMAEPLAEIAEAFGLT